MTSTKNLSNIFGKIVEGTAPTKFSIAHLKSIGFKSSNDVGIIPILKDLGFLSADGAPTQRYHDFRDKSRSGAVMGEALREGYEEIFHINEKPSTADRQAIEGKFKSVHNATDRVAAEQAKTFLALLKLANLDSIGKYNPKKEQEESQEQLSMKDVDKTGKGREFPFAGLRYNVEIHLPASKDIEVYNAIFKSLKEHLLDN